MCVVRLVSRTVSVFGVQLSAWTIVLLTIERFIAVRFPFQCRRVCSLRRVVIAWCIIFVVLFGANCHFFATYAIVVTDSPPMRLCDMLPEYTYLNKWYLIDACIKDLVPFVVIFTGNIAIMLVIAIGNRRRMHLVRCQTENNGRPSKANRVSIYKYAKLLKSRQPAERMNTGAVYSHVQTNQTVILHYLGSFVILYCLQALEISAHCVVGIAHSLSDPQIMGSNPSTIYFHIIVHQPSAS